MSDCSQTDESVWVEVGMISPNRYFVLKTKVIYKTQWYVSDLWKQLLVNNSLSNPIVFLAV